MNYMPLIVNEIPYRTHIGNDRSGGLHWHSEMELFISMRGEQKIELESQVYHLHAGDALILPGYAAHSASSPDSQNYRVAINFGYGLLKSRYPAIQNTCIFVPADDPATPPALSGPIRALLHIFKTDGRVTESNEWRIRGNLFLLCDYLQTVAPQDPPNTELQDRIRMLDNIFTVVRYVEKHYREKIRVEDMATLAGYAKTYFCRQFKRITGVPFYRYLTHYRIQVACMLLDDPGQTIGAVAEVTGFSTQALFCRAFKESTGMTPSQYQHLPQEERNLTWTD